MAKLMNELNLTDFMF